MCEIKLHRNENKGWECPKCGKVYSPDVTECNRCGQHDYYNPNTPIQPYSPTSPQGPTYPWESPIITCTDRPTNYTAN